MRADADVAEDLRRSSEDEVEIWRLRCRSDQRRDPVELRSDFWSRLIASSCRGLDAEHRAQVGLRSFAARRPGQARRMTIVGSVRAQSEKLVPQPQEAVAFGLLIWNDGADQVVDEIDLASRPCSRARPGRSARSRRRARSRGRRRPCARSMSNLYWKPEQPPPSTLTRSIAPAGSLLQDLADPPRRAFGDGDVRGHV